MALQVWDVGGQSISGKMIDKYLYGAQVSINQYLYGAQVSGRMIDQYKPVSVRGSGQW